MVDSPGSRGDDYDHHLLEALWVYQSWREPNLELLNRLLNSENHQARAAAVLVLTDWIDEVPNSFELLAAAAKDEHPLVRLDAIRGLAKIPKAESMLAALEVLDQPMDTFLDYAMWVTARDLQPEWFPAVQQGDARFLQDTDKLLFLFNAMGGDGGVNSLITLVKQNKIPTEQRSAVYRLFLQQPNPAALGLVFDSVLDTDTPLENRVNWLSQLADVSSNRKVIPAGDLSKVAPLLKSDQAELRLAAIRAVGAWKVSGQEAALFSKLKNRDLSVAEQQIVLQALAQLGSPEGLEQIRKIASSSENLQLKTAAVLALLNQNDPSAAALAAELLAGANSTDNVTSLIQPIIANDELAKSFIKEVGSQKLPRDVAVLSLRQIEQSGRKLPKLMAAITSSAQIQTGPRKLSEDEMARMVKLIQTEGDAARGEMIYRRQALACQSCHAIAGAGGRVGPDILSLGASAQPDYLVNSLLDPNDKVKENYHTTVIITDEGKTLSGIKLRETDTAVILRNAEDNEFSVPLDQIDEEIQGTSMMPTGLTDNLTEAEFVDLVRFLSELGRTENFSVSKKLQARSWQVLQFSDEASYQMHADRVSSVTEDLPVFRWSPAYATVDGKLPLDILPGFRIRQPQNAKGFGFARAKLIVDEAVNAEIKLNDGQHLEVWLDAKPLDTTSSAPITLTEGEHWLTIKVKLDDRTLPLAAELSLPADQTSAARWYIGK
ncbi:MAG: HEAT repeat domain-containing protein [Planctomycetaceae bacterium]